MEPKAAFQEILQLTVNEEWVNYPDTVEKVQLLGKIIADERSSSINYQRINGVEVINSEKHSRKYKL